MSILEAISPTAAALLGAGTLAPNLGLAEGSRPTTMKALSIRQPWAYLIIWAGKDIENRDWTTKFRGRVLIHAGKTMTREDYQACALYCSCLPEGAMPKDFFFPTYRAMKDQCGGIVGTMQIDDCVKDHSSPWFCGLYGLVISGAKALPFRPCKGKLGFFDVTL